MKQHCRANSHLITRINLFKFMRKNKTKVGILGFGEIGKAVANFYKNPKIKDLNRDDGLEGVEILHVCIPWSRDFIKIVKQEINEVKPKLTIINSTVEPLTTKKIGGDVVHSPVRGVHPLLYKGIKTFVKYIGADGKEIGNFAKKHYKNLGIKSEVFMPSVTTEIGKILDTTYYGLCIAWHGEMKKICDKFGIKFEEAVTAFNMTYNDGYRRLGKSNVIRPVLFPPRGGIGGHCVIPNAELLRKYYKSKALDFILEYK